MALRPEDPGRGSAGYGVDAGYGVEDEAAGQPADGWQGAGAHGPGSQGAGAHGPGSQEPAAYGPAAYGPAAYGPAAYGPGADGPGADGPGGYTSSGYGSSGYGQASPGPSSPYGAGAYGATSPDEGGSSPYEAGSSPYGVSSPYGQSPYGQSPYGQSPYGHTPAGPYEHGSAGASPSGLSPAGTGPAAHRPGGHARSSRPRTTGGRGRRRHPVLAFTALGVGLAGLLVASTGIFVRVMPRSFTPAQQQQITAWEIGKRWRTWPTGTIFPQRVPYQVPGTPLGGTAGLDLTAQRIGIARQRPCREATDPRVAQVLAKHGCLGVLRATYGDATDSLAVTVGVAVLPSPDAARSSAGALPARPGLRPGVRAVPFRNTAVSRFGDRQRQLAWHTTAGPYLLFVTVGYADGRRKVLENADPYARDEMDAVAGGIIQWVASHLGAQPAPPRCPGAPAC